MRFQEQNPGSRLKYLKREDFTMSEVLKRAEMSVLDKLSIQGIRSFGHEDADKQVVEFFQPLTLIVGQNGAGKTSIIECLRYVTSGDQPPGAKSCFVHDPKVAHETEVKGQVKLKFKDKLGENVVVTRNLMATQKVVKKRKINLRELLLSACHLITSLVVESLGVSKPVLVNVIFCHQEEANWPLSEGKQLKTKFDEIFAATRYIKAVDNIKKIRQEQQSNIKELTIESKYLREDKEKATQLEKDLENQQIRLMAAKDLAAKIDSQRAPLRARVEEIENREQEVQKMDNEIGKLTAGKEQMLLSCREIEDGLENIFDGPLVELKRTYKDHQKETENRKTTLNEKEREHTESSRTLARLRDERSKRLTHHGKLEQEAEHCKGLQQRQKECVMKMAESMNIPGYHRVAELSSQQLTTFKEEVKRQRTNLGDEYLQMKQTYEDREKHVDLQSQEFRDTKSRLEQAVTMKTKQMNEYRSEIRQITDELNQMEDNANSLRELEEELRKAQLDEEKVTKSVDIDELKSDIEKKQQEKKEKDAKLSDLRKEISKLSMQSGIRTKLEMWEKDKRKKEDAIKKIRGKHEEEMTHLLGRFPSENARNKLEDFLIAKKREVRQMQEQLQASKMKRSSEESNQKHILKQLKEKETELRNIEEKLMLECGSQDVDKSLQTFSRASVMTELDQRCPSLYRLYTVLERGALTGSTHLYERYIRSLERTEAQCPLCHRGFDTENEVHELVQELRDKLRLAPVKMKEKENSLVQQREKLSKLQKLQPLKGKMAKLSDQEIPDLKTQLASITEKLEKLTNKIEEHTRVKYVLLMCRMKKTLRRVRTIEEVNNEHGEFEIQVNALNSALELKQRQRDDYMENVQILRGTINSIYRKVAISRKTATAGQAGDKKTELVTNSKKLQRDIESHKEEIEPLKTKLKKLEHDKRDLVTKKETALDKLQTELKTIVDKMQEIDRYSEEINRYLSSGKPDMLRTMASNLEELRGKTSKAEEEESKLKQLIDQLTKDIVKEEIQERDLYDNIQLRKKQAEIKEVDAKLAELQQQRGGLDSTGLLREKHKLNSELSKLFKEKNQAGGRESILKEEVRKVEAEVNSEKYRTAKDKFNNVMIKLKTVEVANKDLDKYSKALDTAIMRYHKMKMEEINKVIKEYWRMTYKGNDIDYIEIQSEADSSSSVTTRKSYNYRVVMVKGDTEMDMRGRCSAGQKVLASLIVRLALAETFCLTCGILALDEPTTNLDRVNIEGLAYALVDIIKSRENQRNFQLIIITHDEDFVELLGRSDYADYFYRVSKNNEAKSVIMKKDIAALT
ncbi:putative DNA repair protein [Apostichopus japonicus]|uniref:Putative DNA repair protein n=1 Tax=Stichopus japonicus TaxID=307972 RepID=A0A2G8LBZ9_STIJA|nr:putative DNA repair protein [Apostichopus japonicus]